jgi:hypothetical protein
MCPNNFTFDPAAIAMAQQVTLKSPNLNVLLPENRDQMPLLAHYLEGAFKAKDGIGKLLLPDLSALQNSKIGIFSDYSGESTGKYFTYSFLVFALGSIGPFREQMAALRQSANLGEKEIAYKDFRMGQLRRAMPAYLRLLDGYVNGMIFTLGVDKSIPSLIVRGTMPHETMVAELEKLGYGTTGPKTAEKLFRVAHTIAFLIALLGNETQKVLWMTDHDAIGSTPERLEVLLKIILHHVLPLYSAKSFPFLGGMQPFEPRALEYLDLLSAADIAAGGLAQYLTGRDENPDEIVLKDGAEHVMRWLCRDSVVLKKFSMMVSRNAKGEIDYGPLDFESPVPADGEIFIPMHLVR